MKQRKIVVIRGLTTAGKSTISYELAKVLPGWVFIDIWKLKEMFEPLGLKDRTLTNDISKEAIFRILKRTIKNLNLNIIIQESTYSTVNKILGKDLKKYNYDVYSFFLDVNLKDAIKRDIQRDKPTIKVNKHNLSEEEWKKRGVSKEKEDFVIDTSKNNINQVIEIILKEIKEKRKDHYYSDKIRKSW